MGEGSGRLVQLPPTDGSKPYLNTWDVPELMDGARAGASNVEQVAFYERSKDVWRSDQKHEKELERCAKKKDQLETEMQIDALREMFPLIDVGLIRSMYQERLASGYVDMDNLTEFLVALNPDQDEPPGEDWELVEFASKIMIDDVNEFPELKR